jgi:hypothetical protein
MNAKVIRVTLMPHVPTHLVATPVNAISASPVVGKTAPMWMSVKQETTPVIAVLPALILWVAMSVNVTLVTQEMVFRVQTLMSVPLGVQSVMRMQIVMTQPAAMSVPASLATLVMDIDVRTFMSASWRVSFCCCRTLTLHLDCLIVLPILVMRMQLVPTIMGASPVSATLDFQETEHHAVILMSVLQDRATALWIVTAQTPLVAMNAHVSVDTTMKAWDMFVQVCSLI